MVHLPVHHARHAGGFGHAFVEKALSLHPRFLLRSHLFRHTFLLFSAKYGRYSSRFLHSIRGEFRRFCPRLGQLYFLPQVLRLRKMDAFRLCFTAPNDARLRRLGDNGKARHVQNQHRRQPHAFVYQHKMVAVFKFR